jgi:hypothetical protein
MKLLTQNIHIATCKGVGETKLTSYRSDEWIHWCSFTITLNSDSLQLLTLYDLLHFLLDHERLPFYYDERRIPAHTFNCLERCLSLESTSIHVFWLTAEPEFYTTDGQSVSLSWNKALIWGLRPDFYYCQTVAVYWYGTLSLTRGRVCRLQWLLILASAVILGSESRGTCDHILLSQIRDFPFLSPPETRRATVEVFEPASTRDWLTAPQLASWDRNHPLEEFCSSHPW